ncbi:MAG TPA: ADP-forming succinate--CoA ligase subunit beta [candidate division Zixibacteria bacterium]|nr:ADP-forming succinate--CoA ligase subunit beta [candidate division Zixibacteria bacterium]MDD4917111.1 ADP-forming succinate--CoA ligase subunit beta [candidate division Zixibacteria bacterium]MDM7972705.1 ADP-forming succinate--CoA ligase subunit beta [candidate division Zixibacteria bacterium]HOD65380.1 ADP-forming succinate--CoA ligase subunit beta [candidate division Zixibacteria bacterium]HOZ07861.1 ADP-forming succinate--CoA ligase subunit beta [candidate division Zixibacteria bacteriu
MRLYEHEGKQLFEKIGIPTAPRRVCRTPEEARAAALELGPVVVKAQVLTGGRGKAGGVKLAATPEEAQHIAADLLAVKIRGYEVAAVLVEPRLDIARELYLGVTIDRANYTVVVIASGEGGVDIEETAVRNPEKIVRHHLRIDEEFYGFDALAIAKQIGLPSDLLKSAAPIIVNLYRLFRRCDAKLVEINPLVLTADNKLIAADARVSLDDDALFRHPELQALGIAHRHEEGEMTPRERRAAEWGIPYLDLDGDIGMFPGGAGFGIMGNDFIHYYGGRPANFMDSGGGPTPERLANMLVLLDENPNVKAIFAARFGGISRCDDFAKGVIKFLREHGLSKPMVMRMTGNMWQEGVRLFEEARTQSPELFARIEIHGIETPIEEISRRAVELARGTAS